MARGRLEANMGIACGDTNGDGAPDVVITHFFGEHTTLWRAVGLSDGRVAFQDQTFEAGVGIDSRPVTGWGVALADFDLDGHLDLIQTNGHIRREPSQIYPYDNPPVLWRNQGDGRFTNVTATAGPYFLANHMGRGLAVGDLDGDGDLDVVVVHYHANSVVLWNETPRQSHAATTVTLRGAAGKPGRQSGLELRHVSVSGHSSARSTAAAVIFSSSDPASLGSAWGRQRGSTAWKSAGPPAASRPCPMFRPMGSLSSSREGPARP